MKFRALPSKLSIRVSGRDKGDAPFLLRSFCTIKLVFQTNMDVCEYYSYNQLVLLSGNINLSLDVYIEQRGLREVTEVRIVAMSCGSSLQNKMQF